MAVETISTVLVAATSTPPAGPYDLTDLATIHDELSLPTTDTADDSFLSRAITQSSKAIARYCNRVFPVEAVQDLIYIQQDAYPWQVPGGVYPLQLSRWPLVNATPVSVTGNTRGTNVVDGIASTAGIMQGALAFASDGSIPSGTTVSSVSTNSITLSAPATASATGVTITIGIQVVQTLSGPNAPVTQPLVYGTDYTVDAAKGWLIRLNEWTGASTRWEAEPVTVQYQAGYSPIPDDLVDACLRLVTDRFRSKGRDPRLIQRAQDGMVGTERYWFGNVPGQTGAFAPEIEALIESYRVPVVA